MLGTAAGREAFLWQSELLIGFPSLSAGSGAAPWEGFASEKEIKLPKCFILA